MFNEIVTVVVARDAANKESIFSEINKENKMRILCNIGWIKFRRLDLSW